MPSEERPRRVRASLLDRLIDEDPEGPPERPPRRTHTQGQYTRSIVRDLQWLLNTRCSMRYDSKERVGRRSVLDFGLDDFTHLVPLFEDDRLKLSKYIQEAIKAFEPRLQIRNVQIRELKGNPRVLEVHFEAYLIINDVREPVSFRAIIDKKRGVKVLGR